MADNIVDCKKCTHYNRCKSPCLPVDMIANGNNPMREQSISDNILDHTNQRDYNQALYELIIDHEARDIERLEAIRTIDDYRSRMIAACILVGIPQQQIAHIAHISQSRISRIYRGVR